MFTWFTCWVGSRRGGRSWLRRRPSWPPRGATGAWLTWKGRRCLIRLLTDSGHCSCTSGVSKRKGVTCPLYPPCTSCMVVSHDLKQKLFDTTMDKIESEKDFLNEIKRLVVKTRNLVVTLVQFMRVAQRHEEDIKSWCTRVMGMAGQCDLRVCCYCQDWASYKKDMILAQLVTVLPDPKWQEKVMYTGSH